MIKNAISKVIEGIDLTKDEMVAVMDQIMTGASSDAQIGSFLTALRIKGETIDEITGAVIVMREKALSVDAGEGPVVDTCGTGGDGVNTFNISTTSAFVTAGAGLTVAKHGNRAVSSASGSADVLKALGVNIEAEVMTVEKCLRDIGIGFLFAPMMHSAMKYAIGPRREIGVRTIFNILGPLTNPAGAKAQVIGVYDRKLIEPLAEVVGNLGAKRVFVVHGSDGLDEITVTGVTYVASWREGKTETFEIDPEKLGMPLRGLDEIKGADPSANAKITRDVLNGEKGACRDVVLLNAAAAIWAGGVADSLEEGITRAEESIDSGSAKNKLELLVKACPL
ncbi:Anthranilate phosphoribosyltransferase [hydrothermal vent metagenome]|uniref:anthranilate phosphoribosyltransferase n=1 Tax=hydrothermal vent metagenome TaxID=652676 RepID=A0A3B1C484_9ZZZZ